MCHHDGMMMTRLALATFRKIILVPFDEPFLGCMNIKTVSMFPFVRSNYIRLLRVHHPCCKLFQRYKPYQTPLNIIFTPTIMCLTHCIKYLCTRTIPLERLFYHCSGHTIITPTTCPKLTTIPILSTNVCPTCRTKYRLLTKRVQARVATRERGEEAVDELDIELTEGERGEYRVWARHLGIRTMREEMLWLLCGKKGLFAVWEARMREGR